MTPMDAATGAGAVERTETEGSAQSAEAPDQNEFVSHLGNSIARRVGVNTVFGEPVNHGAITVIPVARVAWGFGGGSGDSRPGGEEGGAAGSDAAQGPNARRARRWGMMRRGGGGGGGARLQPMGYILVRDNDAEFRPIRLVPPIVIGLIGLLLGAGMGARRRRALRR